MDALTSQEYGLLLRIEYGFWQQAKRQYESGRKPLENTVIRMDLQRQHILNWKKSCREHLDPEDYPEEYYLDTPEPAEKILHVENTPEKLIAVNKIPEGDGTQMNILDYIRDGEICWR